MSNLTSTEILLQTISRQATKIDELDNALAEAVERLQKAQDVAITLDNALAEAVAKIMQLENGTTTATDNRLDALRDIFSSVNGDNPTTCRRVVKEIDKIKGAK